MAQLCAQVTESLSILRLLGRRDAMLHTMDALNATHFGLAEAAQQLAALRSTSRSMYRQCADTALDIKQLMVAASAGCRPYPPFSAPSSWPAIHEALLERLREIGINNSLQQLEELHVNGNPSHLVQVMFATGLLDPARLAAQGSRRL